MKWEYQLKLLDLHARTTGGSEPARERYEELLNKNTGALNALGRQGWEVLTVLPQLGPGGTFHVAVLRRESPT